MSESESRGARPTVAGTYECPRREHPQQHGHLDLRVERHDIRDCFIRNRLEVGVGDLVWQGRRGEGGHEGKLELTSPTAPLTPFSPLSTVGWTELTQTTHMPKHALISLLRSPTPLPMGRVLLAGRAGRRTLCASHTFTANLDDHTHHTQCQSG